jgi:hypothetical protein
MDIRRLAASIAIFVAAPFVIARGQEPSVDEVLARAGAYVISFQRQMSGVVTEESYVQDIVENTTFGVRGNRQPVTHRALKSDLLIVRPEGAERWIQFRDVFDVDGHPVRDRSDRLMKLFVNPSASTAAQVEQIVGESVRYNIGSIQRNFNVPVFALLVLEPGRQRTFTFSRTDADGAPPLARDLAVAGDAWVIRYQERGRHTMIRTTNDRDLPMRGRFWIEPATGRVLMSELIAEDFALRATVIVRYQPGVLPDLLVPAAMREQYMDRRTMMRVNGEATYGRYRQFQVKVDEKIAPIVK